VVSATDPHGRTLGFLDPAKWNAAARNFKFIVVNFSITLRAKFSSTYIFNLQCEAYSF
jgi:hypothetical protein